MLPAKVTKKNSSSHNHIHLCLVLFFGALSIRAVADELDTLQFRASVNKTYDSNLFRQSANEISDQVTVTTAGLRLDKPYSLQRLVIDLNVNDYSYNESKFLDFKANNYDAIWNWNLTPSIEGSIELEQNQSLVDFRNFTSIRKNIRTNKSNKFRVKYSPYQVFSFTAGLSNTKRTNSTEFTEQAGFETNGFDYGIEYKFRSGFLLGIKAQNRTADYGSRPFDVNQAFDRGYKEKEYEFFFSSASDSVHVFKGNISHFSRDYDTFSQRNYSGALGEILYDVLISGKIKVSSELSRSISPFERVDSTYSQTDAFKTGVTFLISDKIQIGLNGKISERDFEGRGQFGTSGRSDKENSFSGFASWKPTKSIGFNLSATKSSRNSTVDFFDFDDRIASLSVEFKL